ncbi:hypothetical protein CLOSTMETH_00323 [[Clostridium] methylpentosum DSM 5476]|uniref:Uncharacterized protein n=1 Tax=[Clostridium] methylpentosum DSM 5476 TaxID=537013 RepID=C0E928_9FIRM|nr:hypothetical protein CLOSTMETH_00323 [[Clostridium] methylpentosum DSM 5476]
MGLHAQSLNNQHGDLVSKMSGCFCMFPKSNRFKYRNFQLESPG